LVPTILEKVLEHPPTFVPRDIKKPGGLSKFFAPKDKESPPTAVDGLVAKELQHVSSILHIFSHIRKTYQPVHLVIEGGNTEPLLKSASVDTSPKKKAADVLRLKWVKAQEVDEAKYVFRLLYGVKNLKCRKVLELEPRRSGVRYKAWEIHLQ
jgi:hypothetical protein